MGQVLMPQMGFDMQEGKLVRWLKKPGDKVERNEAIAEIETDKAVMEIESFEAGVVTKLLVQEGEDVPVGTPIAILNGDEGDVPQPTGDLPADAVAQEPPGAAPAQVAGQVIELPIPEQDGSTPGVAEGLVGAPAAPTAVGERIKASPLARRLARERGIDLARITGTGPGGRIVKADVEGAVAASPAAKVPTPAPSAAPAPGDVTVPLTRMREVIASRMSESKQQAPHFYVSMSVDMGEALAFRKQFNETVDETQRASINDLVVKACGLALAAFPNINASFTGDGIRRHASADIAIAVAIEGGLITPIVRGCHDKSLGDIATEARQLAESARAGRLKPEQYQGGTFTVSNLGMYGVDDFVAIINPPQAAILAVGAIAETPVVQDGAIVARPMMRITLSADHRVTDGAEAAQFLQEVKAILERPLRLLMAARGGKGERAQ